MGLGGIQASTSTTTWRHPEVIYVHHFKQLAAWGYGLSEVKQIVVDATVPGAAEPVETANDDDRSEE